MQLTDFVVKPKAIYLASKRGFENYCMGCAELLGTEETKSQMFQLRVLCRAESCEKSTRVKEEG